MERVGFLEVLILNGFSFTRYLTVDMLRWVTRYLTLHILRLVIRYLTVYILR